MAVKGLSINEGKEFISKLYGALMGDTLTTLSLIAMTLTEIFVPQLTMIFLVFTFFFAIRSSLWKYMDSYDERRVRRELSENISKDQIELRKISLEQAKVELEKDKFMLKRDVVKSQENSRTQIIEQRLRNIEKRNSIHVAMSLKLIEEAGVDREKLEALYSVFNDIDGETEFLAVDGLQVPFEELLVDRKASVPIPNSFEVTEGKFKKINIGEDNDE